MKYKPDKKYTGFLLNQTSRWYPDSYEQPMIIICYMEVKFSWVTRYRRLWKKMDPSMFFLKVQEF